ncbi:MAG: hypothetical protein IPI07_18800 [Flavobacteriales bacterium]|nr:hypothetical protein [Flavobacteriales bacterium]
MHGIEKVVRDPELSARVQLLETNLLSQDWLVTFGDTLMTHHAFSNEPFTKDKFEHALVSLRSTPFDTCPTLPRVEIVATMSRWAKEKFSLKTQADSAIKPDTIWISKYMELGRGDWSDKPEQLVGLRDGFLGHLGNSDRILILRCLKKSPLWKYELVEIPSPFLTEAAPEELNEA